MSKYDEIAQQYKSQINPAEDQAFKTSKFVASQRQPDEYAKVLNISNKLGLDPQLVEGSKEIAFQQASVEDETNQYNNIAKNYRKTSKYLSNPDNATISKDDHEVLKKMEDNVEEHSFIGDLFSSAASGALTLAKGIAQAPAIIAPLANRLMGVENPAQQEQVQAFISNPLTRSLLTGSDYMAPKEMSGDIIEEAKQGNLKKASRVAAMQIASNIPQLGLIAISGPLGLSLLGASGAGQKMEQNVAAGVPLDKAATNAVITSGIETGIESVSGIGGSAFKNVVKNTVAQLGESTAKEVFKNGLKHIFKTSAQEGAEELITSMAQDLTDYGMGVNDKALEGMIQRAANAGIVGAGAGGVTAGGAYSFEASVKTASDIQKSESIKTYLSSYIEDRKESKTYKRIPEKYAEAHEAQVKGTPLAELSVDVEKFNEVVFNQDKTKSPSEVAASLGILEKWELAQQSGHDLTLTPQDMSKMSDEVIKALQNDFKSTGMSKSANDIKLDQEALAAIANTEAISREKVRTRITQDVTQQLVDTGLYNPPDARTNAQAVSSFFNQLAIREGSKAEDLYAKYAPKIVKAASGPQKQGFVSKLKDNIQGSYTPEGRVIQISQARDFSTFVHEGGHFFLDIMQQVQADSNASKSIKDDFQLIQKYVGSKDGNLTNDQHEKFTEAFVNYLQTGKAPSSALKKAFLSFKNWLLSVYKGMRTNPEVSSEIRGVFDRMLATEEEMAELRENYDNTIFSSGAALGMEGKELEKYEAQLSEAREAVQDNMEKSAIDKVNKELSSEFKEVRDLIEKEKTQEADRMMVFKVIEDIKNKDMLGKFNSADIEKIGLQDSFPKQYMKKGGTPIDGLASVYDYNSEFEMLKDIVDNPDKGAYIWDETNNEMARSYPDLYPVFDLSEDAVRAVHGDKREKVLRMQMDFLMKKSSAAVKGIAKSLIKRTPPRKAVQAQAENIISQVKVDDLKPYLYRRAEVKFSKLAGQLFAKGDFEGAFDAKRKEYLNFELYNKAQEALDSKKNDDNFRKFFKKDEDISKTRDLNYVNGARAVLSLYGYGGDKKSLPEILGPLEAYDPESYAGISEIISDVVLSAKPVGEATFAEYQAMKEVVEALWSLAKSVREKTVGDKKVTMEEAVQLSAPEIMKAIPESGQATATKSETKWESFKGVILASKASFTRVEHWAKSLGQNTFDVVFKPISDAAVKYRLQYKDKLNELKDIVNGNAVYFVGNPVVAKGLNSNGTDHVFKKSELMMAILHSGNESNLKKFLVGKKWGSLNEDGTLDSSKWDKFLQEKMQDGTIQKKDLDMAQKIWDLMASLKPQAQKAHKDMYGYYFSEITAKPFETPFGTYQGGYIPAKLDVDGTKDLSLRKAFETFEKENNTYQFPTTGRGFTKSRKEQFHGPLSLDMNLLGSHLGQVLRFSNIEPQIKETMRLLKNSEYEGILEASDPNIIQHTLLPWLERSATQKLVVPSRTSHGRLIDAGASFLRSAAAIQIMFGNVINAAQQPTGLIVAMTKVSPREIMRSMIDYSTRSGQADEIATKSEFMRQAQESNSFEVNQDIEKLLNNNGWLSNAQDFTKRHTYILQTMTQNLVNTITWNAAFNDYMAKNATASEADAVSHADSVVRTTQGTNNAEDVSAFETGGATERLFKQFIGYFNMLYNLNESEFKRIQRDSGLKKKYGALFYLYMTGFALPAFLAANITKALGDKPYDEDDDGYLDDVFASFFGSQLSQGAALVPVPFFGVGANTVLGQYTDAVFDDRLNVSAGLSSLESIIKTAKAPKDIVSDKEGAIPKASIDALTNLSFFLQLPLSPVTKRLNYLNKTDEPTVRGLITGK